ncbi:MAG: class I SAM-dependent methyltransferase [Alphaproteobacteria bacterium]|nr:class I SAM-dependent methyltransferase [Alphaproteobacteria bacterium]
MTTLGVEASFEEETFQGFLRGLKFEWKEEVYRRVVAKAQASGANDPAALQRGLRGDIDYALYAWLEHRGQHFKYLGRYGMLPIVERQAAALEAALAEAGRWHPERLRLDPALALPDYYTRSDFHQHPGGIWSDDVDALMYEWAANAFSFSMVGADRPYAWFADWIAGRFAPRAVADLGCGFGKSTLPVKRALPDSTVLGLDLSAPALRLAHRRAFEADLDIAFLQAPAERTGLAAASLDAVVSTWLLHELPVPIIREVLREGFRILRPGGVFASHDMHTVPGGIVGAFLHLGHAARNNEPFLPGLIGLDLRAELAAAGFVGIEIVDSMTGAPGAGADAPLAGSRTHANSVVLGRKP